MSRSLPELRVTEFLRFCLFKKFPWGLIQLHPVSEGDNYKGDRQSRKREISIFS